MTTEIGNKRKKLKDEVFSEKNSLDKTYFNVGKLEGFNLGVEMARKEFLESKAIIDFTEYCEGIRGDWSDFDGRDLLKVWNLTLQRLKQSLDGRDLLKVWNLTLQRLKQSLDSPLSTGDDGDVSKASISDVQSPICKPETLGDNFKNEILSCPKGQSI